MPHSAETGPIVILGAGINGCALARELLLSGVSVTLVDTADAAFGATAYSSRLIHGGLRYLEYAELDLVRESLGERTRLLRLAPQFVRPLELAIPIENRWGGVAQAAGRFFGLQRWLGKKSSSRGRMLVEAGLKIYDAYARDPTLPGHRIERVAPAGLPVDSRRFRWLAMYYDAQIQYPERFVLALLADAVAIATENGASFQFFNYHRAHLRDGKITISAVPPAGAAVAGSPTGPAATSVGEFAPQALVNATGAWVDRAWSELEVAAPRYMGGTKGSHCFTFHAGLRAALAGRGVYAEASDGRPVFITPLGDATLIGTTDEPFEQDPALAVAREDEVAYLLAAANAIFPAAQLVRDDIAFTYSGVRPLPYVNAATPGAITRRHLIARKDIGPAPSYSIIGGKLTTCRSLAEEAAARILGDLGRPVIANSRDRVLPGGEAYPVGAAALAAAQAGLAAEFGLTPAAVEATWRLLGTRTRAVLHDACMNAAQSGAATSKNTAELTPDTRLPVEVVRWIIRHEWVVTLDDLVERRLMLLFEPQLSRRSLERLASLLVDERRLAAADAPAAVAATEARLLKHFGKRMAP